MHDIHMNGLTMINSVNKNRQLQAVSTFRKILKVFELVMRRQKYSSKVTHFLLMLNSMWNF